MGVLDSLADVGLVSDRVIETEEEPLKVYGLFDCHGLVPLLYLARWVMEGEEFWSNGYFNRKRPILTEEDKDE